MSISVASVNNVILRLPHSPVFPESAKIEKFLFMINYCVSLVAGSIDTSSFVFQLSGSSKILF